MKQKILSKSEKSSNFQNNAIYRAYSLIPKPDRRKLLPITLIQIFLGVFDLIGILAIGLLGSLAAYSAPSGNSKSVVTEIMWFLKLGETSVQGQAIFLGTCASVFMLTRTLLSLFFTRRILYFFSRRAAITSANLISRTLSLSILEVQSRTTQKNLYSLTSGVTLIMMQVLATATVLVSDFSLLAIISIGLFIIDPLTAIITFVLFGILSIMMYRRIKVRAGDLGKHATEMNIKSSDKIVEVLGSYRELVVRNRRHFYSFEIGKMRSELADTVAELSFLPYISKYMVEIAVILGALLVSLVQFVLLNTESAIATLAIFLAAGTRLAPAVLRIQQGAISIKSALGQASPTLDLIDSLGIQNPDFGKDVPFNTTHDGFDPTIQINDVTFSYPQSDKNAISDFSLEIKSGELVAIVGPSGSGKSTFIDVLLGILDPGLGQVKISNSTPSDAISKWPGAIAYVPQDIIIASGTIKENITLGYPTGLASDELVQRAVEISQLSGYVNSLPKGLDTQVGERGAKISGGQRQRLGIARALLTCPKLLVMDEATSSLDAGTEDYIIQSLERLKGEITTIVVSHRLSTIRNVDKIVYFDQGKILCVGSFSDVRCAVPEFNRQAERLGL